MVLNLLKSTPDKKLTVLAMKNESLQKGLLNRIFTSRNQPFALRMAPMIDVTFLLLIFFLVAAKWRPNEDFLPFKLPDAYGQEQTIARPEPLKIFISATQTGCLVQIEELHAVQIDNKQIEQDLVVLMEKIKQCLLAQRRFTTDPVEIICQPQVKWEHLAKIYNAFYGASLTDITFAMTE